MSKCTSKELRNQVIYQIFTRNYRGGTFEAVREDLDRIQSLGVDIIYLLPVQPNGIAHKKGSMGSPYAIRDYRTTDPRQGSMDDFIRLSDAVHARGMQLIIDVVYNHTSPDSVLRREHPEWFYHKPDGSFGNRIGDWWDVIDLDYSHEGLWDYQVETLKYWAQYVDGFRCDVAPFLPLEFWLRARREVEAVRPGCLWIAESVEPEFITVCRKNGIPALSDGELYQAFDICYDYDVYPEQRAVMAGEIPADEYISRVNAQEAMYPDNYVKLRFLENHDRPRAAALVPEEAALRNWTAWCFFQKGTVMLYSGQEAADPHHPTLFDPDPIRLGDGAGGIGCPDGPGSLSRLIAGLSAIKKHEIFSDGSFHAEVTGRDRAVVIAWWEAASGKKACGIFSLDGRKRSVRVSLPDGTWRDEISGREIDVFEGILRSDGEPVILLF